jgi:DNA-binding transcriptional MerR regulator
MMSRVRDKKVTVADLLAAGGISRATLYRWTERGLVPAPEGYEPGQRGPLAVYPPLALTRIQEIRALLDEGFTLAAIEKRLAKLSHT